jgi:uncharacterized membrane protein YoaK (UPF0700 family)
MKKKVSWKQVFFTIVLPVFCGGAFVGIYYGIFGFYSGTKLLMQTSFMMNCCLFAALIRERRKKEKEEKAAKKNEVTEQASE